MLNSFSLLFKASFLFCNFSLMCSAKSCRYYLFIEDKSSSTPFDVVFTGFSFRLLFRIYYKRPARFVDALGCMLAGPKVGIGRFKLAIGGGGGRKLSLADD